MEMEEKRLRHLLQKHVEDTISPDEAAELSKLIQKVDIAIQEEILTEVLRDRVPNKRLSTEKKHLIYQRIHDALQTQEPVKQRYSLNRSTIAMSLRYTAAAMLLVGSLLWVWDRATSGRHSLPETGQHTAAIENDIYLNTDNVPFIRLPNGEIQILDDRHATNLIDLGIEIKTDENGQPTYQMHDYGNHNHAEAQSQMLVFSTPKGMSSNIILSDGTMVWLNSGSVLEYPMAFAHNERRVKLVGEGFFDVKHAKEMPFYVETENGPLIQVVGTSFNVMAYPEQENVTTTLVTGKVHLLGQNDKLSLQPNEQVKAAMNDVSMKSERVSVDEFISWKEGYFNFNGHTIPEILSTVQRWYDIEDVEYKYLPKEKFTGTFKRTKSLRSLLEKLEIISEVKFDINGRRIVVMPEFH
ncbi:MAG TPA: FecR domain-containing protein [Sphingobacterium sp.]|nr:FecR domain-containing protein [Sphingobacterium sp.]